MNAIALARLGRPHQSQLHETHLYETHLDETRVSRPRVPRPRIPQPRNPQARVSRQRSRRIRLPDGPAAAAEARRRVQAAARAWDVTVDRDVAVLLTSEVVTNAVVHGPGGVVTLTVILLPGQLRVEVFDTCPDLPAALDPAADAETGRGLLLVDTLAADWGSYRAAAGKVVWFVLTL